MKVKNSILITLADAATHNWAKLSDKLGLGVVELREQISCLQQSGMFVFNVTSDSVTWIKPYPIKDLSALLSVSGVEELKGATHLALVDSTNTFLKSLVDSDGCVCIADTQYLGYGRRQDAWASLPGPLYCSLAWSWEDKRELAFEQLSVCAAYVVMQTLHNLGYAEIKLKWPNDLYLRDKKLGGILVEMISKGSSLRAIVGIGLNIGWYDRRPEVSQPIISLEDVYPSALEQREAIIVEVVRESLIALNGWSLQQEKKVSNEDDLLFGREVVVLDKNARIVIQGVGAGYNQHNAYLVNTEKGIFEVSSLAMSVKLHEVV